MHFISSSIRQLADVEQSHLDCMTFFQWCGSSSTDTDQGLDVEISVLTQSMH